MALVFETYKEAITAEKEISIAKGYPNGVIKRYATLQQRITDDKWFFSKPLDCCSSGECGTGPSCDCSMRWVSVDFTEEEWDETWEPVKPDEI